MEARLEIAFDFDISFCNVVLLPFNTFFKAPDLAHLLLQQLQALFSVLKLFVSTGKLFRIN